MKNIPIGEVLKEYGYITDAQLKEALDYQKEHRDKRIGHILVELGFVTEKQRMEAVAQRMSVPLIDVANCSVDISAVEKIPRPLAERHQMLAFGASENGLKVITSDPLNLYGIEEVQQAAGLNIEIYISEEVPLKNAINYYYSEVGAKQAAKTANSVFEPDEIEEMTTLDGDGDAPVIKLVQSLIVRGFNAGASDIHIEPFEHKTIVRMRIDGTIVEYVTLQNSIHSTVIARIKIMSDLDIAEKRVPQDGHFRTKIDGIDVNVRTSVIPTLFGEKAVLRLLASKGKIDYASHFGMNESSYNKFQKMLASPNGLIYISGPTGSGKSTTLYMAIESMAGRTVNISTIEDPVEKSIERINQMQVNNNSGLTFDIGLRALLRQDPDIIMVGETRDNETATISVRAAMTGHLVLSTLHTNDAISIIVRLEDMGVERYLLANSLVGLIAQRLMRKVCPHCSKLVEATPEEVEFLGRNIINVKKAVGCPICNNTGYLGRISIHEVAIVDKEMRKMIAEGVSLEVITDYAIRTQGMTLLKDSGADLVVKGITTIDELIKVAYHT